MTIQQVLGDFFATPAGAMVVVLFGLALLDLALGVLAAIRDKVFTWAAIDSWVRRTLAGRIVPVTLVLIVGHLLGGISIAGDIGSQLTSPGAWLTGAGLAAGATIVAATAASILDSLRPQADRAVPDA